MDCSSVMDAPGYTGNESGSFGNPLYGTVPPQAAYQGGTVSLQVPNMADSQDETATVDSES